MTRAAQFPQENAESGRASMPSQRGTADGGLFMTIAPMPGGVDRSR